MVINLLQCVCLCVCVCVCACVGGLVINLLKVDATHAVSPGSSFQDTLPSHKEYVCCISLGPLEALAMYAERMYCQQTAS